MRNRFSIFLALFVFFNSTSFAEALNLENPYGPYVVRGNIPDTTQKVLVRVNKVMAELIETHPRQEIRERLKQLFHEDEVLLIVEEDEPMGYTLQKGGILRYYYSTFTPARVTAEPKDESDPDSARIPALRWSIPFILGRLVKLHDEADDWRMKQLALWHEWQHIKDMLSGTVAPNVIETELVRDLCSGALLLWDSEWRAYKEQWILAKELGVTRLMPEFQKEIRTHGEERGFLEGLAVMLRDYAPKGHRLHQCWANILREKRRSFK